MIYDDVNILGIGNTYDKKKKIKFWLRAIIVEYANMCMTIIIWKYMTYIIYLYYHNFSIFSHEIFVCLVRSNPNLYGTTLPSFFFTARPLRYYNSSYFCHTISLFQASFEIFLFIKRVYTGRNGYYCFVTDIEFLFFFVLYSPIDHSLFSVYFYSTILLSCLYIFLSILDTVIQSL